MPPALLFFLNMLWLSGVFCGSIQILGFFLFYFCEKYHWHIKGIALKLYIILDTMDILIY